METGLCGGKTIKPVLAGQQHIAVELRVLEPALGAGRYAGRDGIVARMGRARFAGSPRLLRNADMGPAEIREICVLDGGGKGPLRAAMLALATPHAQLHGSPMSHAKDQHALPSRCTVTADACPRTMRGLVVPIP